MSAVLHVWPAPAAGAGPLDAGSLAALLACQLAMPGRFAVRACATPDVAPGGTLPCLAHDGTVVTSLPALAKYIAGAGLGDLDGHLSKSDKAKSTAWISYIEAQLGALVAHALFVLPENWRHLTHPALVAALPLPHRYFVPHRIRESHKARLVAAGLWAHAASDEPAAEPLSFAERQAQAHAKQSLSSQDFKQAFSRQKVLTKARAALDTCAMLLGDRRFCMDDSRPAFVDAVLAAHVLVLIEPAYADPLLKTLLTDSYPVLVQHARRVKEIAESAPGGLPHAGAVARPPLLSLLPSATWLGAADRGTESFVWAWVAAAGLAGSVGYLAFIRAR